GEMRFRLIEDHQGVWPVRVMCDALSVSPSGYYAWRLRPDSPRKIANRALLVDIRRVHAQHQERYGAPRIHAELRAEGQTVSRKGNCWDNAPMESFFGTLKTELVHHRQYPDRDRARRDLFAYIEGYYNRARIHSAIGYIPPQQAEAKAANPASTFPGEGQPFAPTSGWDPGGLWEVGSRNASASSRCSRDEMNLPAV